jgi:putative transposase
MVQSDHATLSIVRQCALLSLSRSGLYYERKGESCLNLELMREMDKAFTQWPFFGVRQMCRYLISLGYNTGRKRVHRLMRLMGLMAIYQKPRTSVPHPENKRYPYLLREMTIKNSNQVWCADITYIPMRKGFLYLVAIMDWYSRKVLSWRLSNSMDTDFCLLALEEALAKYGTPGIFNTDQGSQFTSSAFTNALRDQGISISMDGRGRWLDNVFIERLWRSLKYEEVYLHAYENGTQARAGIGKWIAFYNQTRPHSSLAGVTPDLCYGQGFIKAA